MSGFLYLFLLLKKSCFWVSQSVLSSLDQILVCLLPFHKNFLSKYQKKMTLQLLPMPFCWANWFYGPLNYSSIFPCFSTLGSVLTFLFKLEMISCYILILKAHHSEKKIIIQILKCIQNGFSSQLFPHLSNDIIVTLRIIRRLDVKNLGARER